MSGFFKTSRRYTVKYWITLHCQWMPSTYRSTFKQKYMLIIMSSSHLLLLQLTVHCTCTCRCVCYNYRSKIFLFLTKNTVSLGDYRRCPYPATGGMSILTPLALGNSKMLFPPPPPPPHALQIPKSLSPPPFRNFPFFSGPLEFLFDCLKLIMNGKLALFPPAK